MIDALLRMWSELPPDAITVRCLVQEACAAQAAIHYHFGDMERLYLAASESARSAAQGWMARRLAMIAPLGEQACAPALRASVLADTIACWTGEVRPLAMAARRAPGPDWDADEQAFWERLAAALGLADHAATIACYARGEAARHLLVWNPPLDRALLEETTAALVLWIAERRTVPDAVRPVHRAIARAAYREPQASAAPELPAIAGAAADCLAAHGHAGVTFRAVAARAGVTLGKVVHHAGTKAELFALALHRLYEREALDDRREAFVAQSFSPEEMRAILLEALRDGRQPVLEAYDEIERAIYNGEEFRPLRGVVRAMEDPSGTWALTQLIGGREPPASLVAAFSAVIRGIGFSARHSGAPRPDAAASAAQGDVAALAERAIAPFVG